MPEKISSTGQNPAKTPDTVVSENVKEIIADITRKTDESRLDFKKMNERLGNVSNEVRREVLKDETLRRSIVDYFITINKDDRQHAQAQLEKLPPELRHPIATHPKVKAIFDGLISAPWE